MTTNNRQLKSNKEPTHIVHISDIHARTLKRHDQYIQAFNNLYNKLGQFKKEHPNFIIVIAGDLVHSKLVMSPQMIVLIQTFLKKLSQINQTIVIPGNHDGQIYNKNRLDALTPIVTIDRMDNVYYLKNNQILQIGNSLKLFHLSVFNSLKQKFQVLEQYKKQIDKTKKNVMLYHGVINGSKLYNGHELESKISLSDFSGFDYVMLGDIHKHQTLSKQNPVAHYSGSLICQDFGQDPDEHGISIWDLKKDLIQHIQIDNPYKYYTINVQNNKYELPQNISQKPNVRLVISNTKKQTIQKIIKQLKQKVDELTSIITVDNSNIEYYITQDGQSSGEVFDLLGNIKNIDNQNKLIQMFGYIQDDKLQKIKQFNKQMYDNVLNSLKQDQEINIDFIKWQPVKLQWSNMFSYGQDNVLNFNQIQNGIIGILGKNFHGKSSILNILSFCLFDKCQKAFKAINILNSNKDQMSCKLQFMANGIEYQIVRLGKLKGDNIPINVQFYRYDKDGNKFDLSGTRRQQTNKQIIKIVGSYEDFTLTTMSVQNDFTGLVNLSKTQKKKIIYRFFNLTLFQKLFEQAKQMYKPLKSKLDIYLKQNYLQQITQKQNQQIQLKEQIDGYNGQIQQFNKLKQNNLIEINKRRDQIKHVDIDQIDIQQIDDNIKQFENKLDKQKINKSKVEQQIQQHNDKREKENLPKLDSQQLDQAKKQKDRIFKELSSKITELKMLKQSSQKIILLRYNQKCDACDDNSKVFDVSGLKNRILKLEKQIKQLQQDNKNIITRVDIIQKIRQRLRNSSQLHNKRRLIQTQIQLLQNKIQTAKQKIYIYNNNKSKIQLNQVLKDQINNMQKQNKVLDLQINLTNENIKKCQIILKINESKIKQLKQNLENRNRLQQKCNDIKIYLDLMGKDGLPWHCINYITPMIQRDINTFLSQMVQFKVKIQLDNNNIQFLVVRQDKQNLSDTCSGMEKFVLSLAIRFSLIKLSSIPRADVVFIDQGFSVLDKDNSMQIYKILNAIKQSIHKVFLISHLQYIQDFCDYQIKIQLIDGYSKIFIQ